MSVLYELFLYDHTGKTRILLQGWKQLEFHQRDDDAWNHILRMDMSYKDDRVSLFRDELVRDWIIKVYRRDSFTNERDLVYEGFHSTLVDQVLSQGTIAFTMYGQGYTKLLERRIVVPAAGSSHSIKTGAAETVIKSFVGEQAINPTDTDRIIQGLSNEADIGSGDTATYSARYALLSTVVARLAEQGNVDYGIVGTGIPGNFELQVRPLWGDDLRVGNTAGNPPTIFDVFFGNMDIPILSDSGSGEKTFVYIGGQASGAARTIRTLESASSADTPWGRREAFVDARSESTNDGLDTRGQAYLNEHEHRIKFTFNIIQSEGTRWLSNWKLGDIITARYFSREFSMKIAEVTVVVTAGTQAGGQIEIVNAELELVT